MAILLQLRSIDCSLINYLSTIYGKICKYFTVPLLTMPSLAFLLLTQSIVSIQFFLYVILGSI
jgi:hypothetical protein